MLTSNSRVLVLAMVLSYAVSDWIEGGVITAVIILNVTIGFFQEYRACVITSGTSDQN